MYKFSEREKVMLIILAFFLLFTISWVYLIQPALMQLNVLRSELVELEDNRIASQQLIMRVDVMQESYEENTALIEEAKAKLYMPMGAEEVDRLITAMLLENNLTPEAMFIDLLGYEKAIEESIDASDDGQADTVSTFYTITLTARGSKKGFRGMLDAVNNASGLTVRSYNCAGTDEDCLIDMAIDLYIYDEARLDAYDMVIGPMVPQ